MNNLKAECVKYIERFGRNYPYGLERKFVSSKDGRVQLVVIAKSETFREAKDLISAALCKGLGVAPAEVLELEISGDIIDKLNDSIEKLSPTAIVIFGDDTLEDFFRLVEDRQVAQSMTFSGVALISTCDPIEVLENPAMKRAFWDRLKIAKVYLAQ